MLVKATGTMAATAAKQGAAHQQPSRRPPRGAFIVLEGVDRCGKTTQSKLLLQRLVAAGLAAQAMRFPNRSTATGRIINEYLTMSSSSESDESRRPALDDCAIHLLFSANRWEASRDILETLANGTTIVCDRYAHSGVAFTASKNTVDNNHQHDKNDNNHTQQQQQQQLSLEWCRAPDRGLPAPDAVIYLQLSADQAEERGGYVRVFFVVARNVERTSAWIFFVVVSLLFFLPGRAVQCRGLPCNAVDCTISAAARS
jgi:thymidylate kinase